MPEIIKSKINFNRRLAIAIVLFFLGIINCYGMVAAHRSYSSDSGSRYRGVLQHEDFAWDYTQNRLSDLVFQAPGLAYLKLYKFDYNFQTWLAIMDWSRFAGEFFLFFAAIAISLYKKNDFVAFMMIYFTYVLYFSFSSNCGGDSGSALGFFVLLASLFLNDLHYKHKWLALALMVAMAFGYQFMVLGLLVLLFTEFLKIKKSKKLVLETIIIFLSLIIASGFMISKLADPVIVQTKSVHNGLDTLYAVKPFWIWHIWIVAIAMPIMAFIRNKPIQFFINALLVGSCIDLLYYTVKNYNFATKVLHASSSRASTPLLCFISVGLCALPNIYGLGKDNLSAVTKLTLVSILAFNIAVVFGYNIKTNEMLKEAHAQIAELGAKSPGCTDIYDESFLNQLTRSGITRWSLPIVSILIQEKKVPDYVFVTLSEDPEKRGRRTCANSFDIGLEESDIFEQTIKLEEHKYIDYRKLVKNQSFHNRKYQNLD